MKIRNTERNHVFADKIENEIPFHSLQGLTLDKNYNFSAGIEAVEYSENETVSLNTIFSFDDWKGKHCLCNELDIPLYLLSYKHKEKTINIYEVEVNGGTVSFYTHSTKNFNDFCSWYAKLKGTIQEKPLYEADSRKSFFDNLIESNGIYWGGNIDGYIVDDDENIRCIIETRLSNRALVNRYDPSRYFKGTYRKKGDYKTWEPLFLLAIRLEIPLFLLTFSRLTTEEKVGFSTLDSMSQDAITFQDDFPQNNILEGVDSLRKEFETKLNLRPPRIIS